MPDADRVGRVYLRRPRPDGTERIDNNISYLRYTEMRDHTRAFATTAASLSRTISASSARATTPKRSRSDS